VFTGEYVINPLSGEKTLIWIAYYVLSSYGTGAVMAVPSGDQRDYEFAKIFDLPIIEIIEGGDISEAAYDGDGPHINSGELNGLYNNEAIEKAITLLEQNNAGTRKVNYKLRDWLFSRQRYWGEPMPVIHGEDGSITTFREYEFPLFIPETNSR